MHCRPAKCRVKDEGLLLVLALCLNCLAVKENWLLPAKQSLPPFHHLLQESKLCHAAHKSFLCCLSAIFYPREAWMMLTSSWTPPRDTCTHTGALPVHSARLFLAFSLVTFKKCVQGSRIAHSNSVNVCASQCSLFSPHCLTYSCARSSE